MKIQTPRQTLFHDIKIVFFTMSAVAVGILLHLDNSEKSWDAMCARCEERLQKAQKYSLPFELRKKYDGVLFETVSMNQLVSMVEECADNKVNNVLYMGTSKGYDYFIHNSDFRRRRVKTEACVSAKIRLTKDVTRWIAATGTTAQVSLTLQRLVGGVTQRAEKQP